YFFFQAEDGIRDFHVTGVQTCALPILKYIDSGTIPNGKLRKKWGSRFRNNEKYLPEGEYKEYRVEPPPGSKKPEPRRIVVNVNRSEERRVGKECRTRWQWDE